MLLSIITLHLRVSRFAFRQIQLLCNTGGTSEYNYLRILASDPKSSTAMEMTTEDIDRHEANGSVDPSTTLTSTAAPETPPSMTKPSLPSDPANLKKQSKRKSIAVPEHRVKRTPKKPGLEPQLNVEPGQYWLCKMSGYPDWPCIICDESILSKEMRNQRPVTARQPDGEFKPDYADGGRKERERTYPVLFLDSFLSL